MTLSEPNARAATILINKIDTCVFESLPDHRQGRLTRLGHACLDLPNCHNTDFGPFCEFLLAPIKESASRSALLRRNHDLCLPYLE
jgi:hypothetical protein